MVSRRHGLSSTPQNPGNTQDQGFILGCGMSQAGKTNQERQRERDGQTEIERQRGTHREIERQTYTQRVRDKHRDTETHTEIQR